MALVAEYRLACDHLPLVTVAEAVPAATLDLRVGQPNQGSLPPFFVRAGGETASAYAALERAFEDAAFVGEYSLLSQDDRGRQYQVLPAVGMVEQLQDVVAEPERLEALATNESVVEHIRVTPDGWVQTRWFAHREAFDEYRTFWADNGVEITVRRLSRPAKEGTERLLTDRQREAICTAYEMGYFDIPRTTSLAAVAETLDISAPALSERLRRAHTRLVEAFMTADDGINGLTT